MDRRPQRACDHNNVSTLEGCCVETYLMLDSQRNAFSVHCWHAYSTDPYKTLTASTLDEAVDLVKAEFDN